MLSEERENPPSGEGKGTPSGVRRKNLLPRRESLEDKHDGYQNVI